MCVCVRAFLVCTQSTTLNRQSSSTLRSANVPRLVQQCSQSRNRATATQFSASETKCQAHTYIEQTTAQRIDYPIAPPTPLAQPPPRSTGMIRGPRRSAFVAGADVDDAAAGVSIVVAVARDDNAAAAVAVVVVAVEDCVDSSWMSGGTVHAAAVRSC